MDFRQTLEDARVFTSINFASVVIFVYDYVLTFEDERTLMWPKRWSLLKVMFLMVRYLPIIDLSTVIASQSREDLSPGACAIMYKIVCWTIALGVMTSEGIVLIRIYAIWKNKRFILIFLLAWTVVNSIPALVLMQFYTKSLQTVASPADFNGCCCCIMSGSNALIGDWILVIAYESVLLVLLVIRGCQMHREVGNTALYLAMFRDGSIFYVCIFALSVGNVIVISALSHDRSRFCFLASLERVMHSVLTGRLLFTLQKASRDGIYATLDVSTQAHSLDWSIPLISSTDEDSHTGALDFAVGGKGTSTFFPVCVAFFAQGSLVRLGSENVSLVENGEDVEFIRDVTVEVDEYVVI